MPRPKRAKVTPSVPTARVAKSIAASTVKQSQDTSTPKPLRRGIGTSDDSEGIVTTNAMGVNRRGVAKQEAVMSGALAPEDIGTVRFKPLTGRQRAALSKVARIADQSRAIEALKARRNAALAAERGEQVQVPSSIPERPVVAGNARTIEKETLEPSDIENIPSETESETREPPLPKTYLPDLAAFKRRPRKPSLLQPIQPQLNSPNHDSDLDDFFPNDESTPFALKPQSHIPGTPTPQSSSSSNRVPSTLSRKRKITPPEVQVPSSQSPPPQTPPSAQASLHEEKEAQLDLYVLPTDDQDNEASPRLPRPRPNQTLPPNPQSDTMAPPQSSSTPSPQKPARTKPLLLTKNPRKQPQNPQPLATTRTRTRAPKTLSTATLQNLLPKRRQRPNRQATAFSLHSSSSDAHPNTSDNDADELSSHIPRKRSGARNGLHAGDAAAGGTKQSVKKAKGAVRTYVRKKVAAEKENEGEVDGSLGVLSEEETAADGDVGGGNKVRDGKARRELKRMAVKFREVDEWALEFEEDTKDSSSPWDAR
ncbi:hypothetical protein MMC12_004271 [Toensbergia leucococca]|nr:hypothetical protein [Toensbergia leucococca]